MSSGRTFLFAGGGTGGHIFPALAIAEALRGLAPDAAMHFAGSASRIEARVVPANGFAFHPIWISGVRRRWDMATALIPLKIAVSLVQSWALLRRLRPAVVVGTGGYVSGPVLFTAAMCGYPTLIQEQNSRPGVTTRMLARRVDEVHIAFDGARAHLARARRVVESGNPVRRAGAAIPRDDARAMFGFDASRPVVFVFGGSQGAASINRAVATLLPRLAADGVQLLWQTGEADHAAMKVACAQAGVTASVHAFIDAMHAAYAAADVVICRAGAASLAELTALGKAAILVPYKYAAANHQYHNARELETAGAAVLLEDDRLDRLEEVVFALLDDRDTLRRIGEASRRTGRPDAARTIADAVLRLADTAARRRS